MKGVYKYLVGVGGAFILFLFSLLIFSPSGRGVSDALFFTGGITASVGALLVLFEIGELDSLCYIFTRGLSLLVPSFRHNRETFYDYKKRRLAKRREPPYYIVFLGLSVVFASAVCLFI